MKPWFCHISLELQLYVLFVVVCNYNKFVILANKGTLSSLSGSLILYTGNIYILHNIGSNQVSPVRELRASWESNWPRFDFICIWQKYSLIAVTTMKNAVVVTLCGLQFSAESEYYWDWGTGNVAHFCDHHGDEIRWCHIIDKVEKAKGVDAPPIKEKVTLATASGDKVIGVTWVCVCVCV